MPVIAYGLGTADTSWMIVPASCGRFVFRMWIGIFFSLTDDSVVYRMGLALTRREARQLVVHSHYTVNGKKVNIPSYRVKVGDVIALKEKDRTSEKFKATVEETKDRIVPTWLDAKKDDFSATVTRLPSAEDIDYEVATHLIVELYSK